ncbi:MAG TPA: hypothetical protein VFF45_00315 [Bacilli bacterium]|nr:hypothetical protein [Bacilli bacterium]
MCCFSRPVRHVSQTHIFARSAAGGRQLLVYSMNIALTEDLAMVLPLPTPPGAAEDAVRFVDLSGYPTFFADLHKGFSDELLPRAKGMMLSASAPPERRLEVHTVGEFEASFVPSVRDFGRLDERFRLPPGTWGKLPQYRDYSFAVFKLRRPRGLFGWLRRMRTIHPMALDFPRRDPHALFFPTVHIHDGEVHAEADFDHSLYCQPDKDLEILLEWERSSQPLGRLVDVDRAAGVVDGTAYAYRQRMLGKAPNRDVVLDEAKLRAGTALGERFLLRVHATANRHSLPPTGDPTGWPELAAPERDRLREELSRKLLELTRDRAQEWKLARYRGDLPERWPTLVETFPEAHGQQKRDEPCRIKFFVWNQRVVPQEVSLAFREEPSRELRDAITADLQKALDEVSGS